MDETLAELNERLQELNHRLELSNSRMVTAIILLTDIIDSVLPHIHADEQTLEELRAANLAAREAALAAGRENRDG